jgi:Tfp pilus assembly protein PilF
VTSYIASDGGIIRIIMMTKTLNKLYLGGGACFTAVVLAGIKLRTICTLILLVCLVSACTKQAVLVVEEAPPEPTVSYPSLALFGAAPEMLAPEQLFKLTAQQQSDFLAYFSHPDYQEILPNSRVADYLQHSTFDFSYMPVTLVASESLDLGEGNCMSLAILTTALARAADVKINYQLIDSSPVFEQKDDVIVKGVHVRTKLLRPYQPNSIPVLGLTGTIVDYFPSGINQFLGNISEAEFISMYYLNIATDFIQEQDYKTSYWFALRALEFAPNYAAGITAMALVYKRVGEQAKAEEIYRFGLEVTEDKLGLLKNYHILLTQQGRSQEADDVQHEIDKYVDLSPYPWINIADGALEMGEYPEAIKYYKKSIELAPYLQYGYLGLAKVYNYQGDLVKAKSMLEKAIGNNTAAEITHLYHEKLTKLEARLEDARTINLTN